MKYLKYFGSVIGLIVAILFFTVLVEYDAGKFSSKGDACTIPKGKSTVYVHWFKPMNSTISNFCDGTVTPNFYEVTEKCDCSK